MTGKVLRDSLIIGVITLILLMTLEISLRIVYPDKIPNSGAHPREIPYSAYEFDSDYLIRLKPNTTKTYVRSHENGGQEIHWKSNSNSFRGDELRDNVKTKIVVYGDSNIQARFSKNENTFVSKLRNHLTENGIFDTEVVNAGIIGYGPDQSLIRFEIEEDVYKPDLVIFHIFADNDFGDLIRNRLFDLDTDEEILKTHHERIVKGLIGEKIAPDAHQGFVDSLLIMRASRKIGRLLRGRKNLISQGMSSSRREFLVYKESRPMKYSPFNDRYDFDVALDPGAESSITKVKFMAAILRRANEFAHSKGVEFLVLIQPSQWDLTRNGDVDFEDLQNFSSKYNRRILTHTIDDICIAHSIHFIDLFDVFMENDPSDLYFRGSNNHWNDLGQALAAKETALFILEKRLIAKSSTPDLQDSR